MSCHVVHISKFRLCNMEPSSGLSRFLTVIVDYCKGEVSTNNSSAQCCVDLFNKFHHKVTAQVVLLATGLGYL